MGLVPVSHGSIIHAVIKVDLLSTNGHLLSSRTAVGHKAIWRRKKRKIYSGT